MDIRNLHTAEATGSIPVAPTIQNPWRRRLHGGDAGIGRRHTTPCPPRQHGSPARTRPTTRPATRSRQCPPGTTRSPTRRRCDQLPRRPERRHGCPHRQPLRIPSTWLPLSLAYGQRGGTRHRDGGTDPTELLLSAQPASHRPTGACNTNHIIPPSRIWAALLEYGWVDIRLRRTRRRSIPGYWARDALLGQTMRDLLVRYFFCEWSDRPTITGS